ncbi:MAG: FKBP-type peptidyl-prolyl cis-trans isomerase [Hyphomonadaceae bacterium]
MINQILIAAALLALGGCGNNGGVMQEIERAEANAVSEVEGTVNALGAAVTEEQQTLPSGLALEFNRRGHDQSLAQPSGAAQVLVHYEGSLADGSVFDSSFARNEPAEFPLNAVVPGFSEAIQNMRPGDEVVATFPAELGYGAEGRPPVIPQNAALTFRIVLLAYQEPGGQPVAAQPRG